MIGIKNLTGETILGRFDGKDYRFDADAKVVTPIADEAARHIFGYGERDKTKALLRMGWIRVGQDIAQALEKLGLVQFLAVEMTVKDHPEAGGSLPRSVSSEGQASSTALSPAEAEFVKTLNKPGTDTRNFARSK